MTGASGTSSPTSSDREVVARLLGREPFTDFRVAVRCPHGTPAVLENDPVDLAGRPFPTRFWLACRALGLAVSRLEAAGGVRRLESDPAMTGAVGAAHAHHQDVHAGYRVGGVADPSRVKCLHAQLALAMAVGGNAVGDWILGESGARWPDACCAPEAE